MKRNYTISEFGSKPTPIGDKLKRRRDATVYIDKTSSELPYGKEKLEAFSDREKDIIACVTKGMSNKEIADELYLSVHTVTTHQRNISNKLQIHTIACSTIYAIANKLVNIEDILKE